MYIDSKTFFFKILTKRTIAALALTFEQQALRKIFKLRYSWAELNNWSLKQ